MRVEHAAVRGEVQRAVHRLRGADRRGEHLQAAPAAQAQVGFVLVLKWICFHMALLAPSYLGMACRPMTCRVYCGGRICQSMPSVPGL